MWSGRLGSPSDSAKPSGLQTAQMSAMGRASYPKTGEAVEATRQANHQECSGGMGGLFAQQQNPADSNNDPRANDSTVRSDAASNCRAHARFLGMPRLRQTGREQNAVRRRTTMT